MFVERDAFSDDRYHLQGSGLVCGVDQDSLVVLTARSLADGGYTVEDGIGEPEIEREVLRVRFADGEVRDATMFWHDRRGADLALLHVSGPPMELPAPAFASGEPDWNALRLVRFSLGEVNALRYQPIPQGTLVGGDEVRAFPSGYPLPLEAWLGAVAVDAQERVVAVLGRREALSSRPALSVIERLPEEWRAPR